MTCTSETESAATAEVVRPRRILVVDDHPLFRRGVVQMTRRDPGLEVCGEANNAEEAMQAVRELRPDIVLTDVSMPGANGIELVRMILSEDPNVAILVISMHDEAIYALRALRAGAKGYIMKEEALDHILEALKIIASGQVYLSAQFRERLIFKIIQAGDCNLGSPVDSLSDRELEILQLVGRGKSTREISEMLFLSVKTIETHRTNAKNKLHLPDGTELVTFAKNWVAGLQGS